MNDITTVAPIIAPCAFSYHVDKINHLINLDMVVANYSGNGDNKDRPIMSYQFDNTKEEHMEIDIKSIDRDNFNHLIHVIFTISPSNTLSKEIKITFPMIDSINEFINRMEIDIIDMEIPNNCRFAILRIGEYNLNDIKTGNIPCSITIDDHNGSIPRDNPQKIEQVN